MQIIVRRSFRNFDFQILNVCNRAGSLADQNIQKLNLRDIESFLVSLKKNLNAMNSSVNKTNSPDAEVKFKRAHDDGKNLNTSD